MLALSHYSNEIPIMNDCNDTVDCSCTFQIETDKLGFPMGLPECSPVNHSGRRKIMNKSRARQLLEQIGGDGARTNEPVNVGVFAAKRSGYAVVQINVTGDRPVIFLRSRSF